MQQPTLKQVSDFIRKEFPLFMVVGIALLLFGLFLLGQYLQSPTKNYEGVLWMGKIIPGQTTTAQLKQSLGEPTSVSNENSKTIYSYPTTNDKRPSLVEIEDDKVKQVEEPVISKERGSLTDYTTKLGKPEAIIYGKHGFAAPGNFWGSKGIIVFANQKSGLIIEIWYIKPTTVSEFLTQNPDFKTSPSEQDIN